MNSKHLKLDSENHDVMAICKKTNEFVGKYSEIVMFIMKYVAGPCLICPKLFFSWYNYFTTDLGNDAFRLPLAMRWVIHGSLLVFKSEDKNNMSPNLCGIKRFPYDWQNPVGYLVAVSIQLFTATIAFRYIGCFTLLAFGGFMFALAIVQILKDVLLSINNLASFKNRNHKLAKNEKLRKNIYEKLFQFIQMHAHLQQWVNAWFENEP